MAYRFNYRIEVNNEKKKGNITIFIFNCIQRWRKKYIGININETDLDVMSGMGFTIPIIEGECLLPSPEYGKPFFDNAEGKITIHKDQKKETAYKYREWDFKDWHGNWHSASAFIPYKKYPRTQEPPLNI